MTDGLRLAAFGCRAVRHLDLKVEPGHCVGIAGPSGAGKSLFLRAVADLDLHEGQMWLDGFEAATMPAPQWRRQVALLPAESAWWYDTVGEHFDGPPPHGLEQLGFDRRIMAWQVAHLSSGERQRLALLRVLGNQPRVLLLDEPTANLDEANTQKVEALVAEYLKNSQPAVVWVSHDLDQLQRWCDPIFTLAQGQMSLLDPSRSPHLAAPS